MAKLGTAESAAILANILISCPRQKIEIIRQLDLILHIEAGGVLAAAGKLTVGEQRSRGNGGARMDRVENS